MCFYKVFAKVNFYFYFYLFMVFIYSLWNRFPESLKRRLYGRITKHPEWYGVVSLTDFLFKK